MRTTIRTRGKGFALRITKPMARTAGLVAGSRVRVTAKPGRIVIDADIEPSLDQMLATFDPQRHGGEAFADGGS